MKRIFAWLLLTPLLASCGLQAQAPRGLAAGPWELRSTSPALEAELRARIDQLGAGSGRPVLLELDEKFDRSFPAVATKGHASKRELRYELSYRLLENGVELHQGGFTSNQAFDNDETQHRANELSDNRFAERARERALDYMLLDLQRQLER